MKSGEIRLELMLSTGKNGLVMLTKLLEYLDFDCLVGFVPHRIFEIRIFYYRSYAH